MGGDDRQDRKGKQRQLIAMPYLFGYQKDHAGANELLAEVLRKATKL